MLTRSHRFHGYGSLKVTYSRGFALRSGGITARYLHQSNGRPYRVAVVVSKKVSKSAVVRNRIRRRVYEVVRRNEQYLQPGSSLVLTIFTEQVATQEAATLEAGIQSMLQKLPTNSGQNS